MSPQNDAEVKTVSDAKDETIAELRRQLVNMTKERDMLVEIKVILEQKIDQLEARLRLP